MKRWLIIGVPLALLTLLLLVRPPTFSSYHAPLPSFGATTAPSGQSGLKAGSPQDDYDDTGKVYLKKPAYQGHSTDKY